MAYLFAPERITIEIEDGPTVEVGPLSSWALFMVAASKVDAYAKATGAAELVALRDLYEFFVAEAQPTFEVIGPRGVILPNVEGLLRLPLPITMRMISGWIDTGIEKTTAADEILPEGPVRDAINLELRRKRRKAA